MPQKIIKLFLGISIGIFLSACISNKQIDSASPIEVPQEQSSSARENIIGLWEIVGENGEQEGTLEFINSEEFLKDFTDFGKYEFLSDETIAFYLDQDTRLLRLIDISQDRLIVEENGNQITLNKIPEVTNLSRDIVGVWEWSDGTITEFAKNGVFLTNIWFYQNEYYKVISNNTVAVYEGEQLDRLSQFFTFRPSENNSLVAVSPKGLIMFNLGYENVSDGSPSTLIKLNDYPNLANDIIGTWKNQDGDVALEFVSSGKMIAHQEIVIKLGDGFFSGIQEGVIYSYEIISGNTIMVLDDDADALFFNVLNISTNTLDFRIWDPNPKIFTAQHQFAKAK